MKGADDSVLSRLAPHQEAKIEAAKERLEATSNLGLRTLCFAVRDLEEKELNLIQSQLAEANLQMENRSNALNSVYDGVERSLNLQAVTAIEDKLQPRAPETIAVKQCGVSPLTLN